ncbi:MAG: ABC transporter permease [Chloroflexi bacterium]|nr:ABC transporter permease [Chloroflexota bacterium]MBV9896756.1 ABC transporter permease [Chloroflexota bacterium]
MNAEVPMVRIQPSQGWVSLKLGDIWEHRELVYFLAWRDVAIRYKQTIFGATWAIIQPLIQMVAFSLFFGQLAQIPSNGIPYPIFSYAALLPWNYFATALAKSSNSLVGQQNLINKVYFPRLVLPLSSVLAPLLDFGIAFLVLLAMMVFYAIAPTPAILLVPLLVLLSIMSALGAGLWLSALNVDYRDVGYIVPFLVQIWMVATPVAYPSSLLTDPWLYFLYGLNPMAGVIEGFRWVLLGAEMPTQLLLQSITVSVLLIVSGALYYRRAERSFADIA